MIRLFNIGEGEQPTASRNCIGWLPEPLRMAGADAADETGGDALPAFLSETDETGAAEPAIAAE